MTKGLRGAVARIAAHAPELGGHLTGAVRTGYHCSYEPDPTTPIRWEVETGWSEPQPDQDEAAAGSQVGRLSS